MKIQKSGDIYSLQRTAVASMVLSLQQGHYHDVIARSIFWVTHHSCVCDEAGSRSLTVVVSMDTGGWVISTLYNTLDPLATVVLLSLAR